jgi:hypothetical protein
MVRTWTNWNFIGELLGTSLRGEAKVAVREQPPQREEKNNLQEDAESTTP